MFGYKRISKRLLLLIVVVVVLTGIYSNVAASTPSVSPNVQQMGETTRFIDQNGIFSFNYPLDWVIAEDEYWDDTSVPSRIK